MAVLSVAFVSVLSVSELYKRQNRYAVQKRLILNCRNGVTGEVSASFLSSCCGSAVWNGRSKFSHLQLKHPLMIPRDRHPDLSKNTLSCRSLAEATEPPKDVKSVERQRKVVVTGMGLVTPIGHDPHVFYNNLLDGVSGISKIESIDCSELPTKIAGEIKKFSADEWVSPKLSKRADKFMLYLLVAGKKAMADAGVTEEVANGIDKTRCGVITGSTLGGAKMLSEAAEALRISYKKINPFCIPFSTMNMGPAALAIDLGWMGPSYSISAACATSTLCMLHAAEHIISGDTDLVLCGGSEAAIFPFGLGSFIACKALSRRNNEPTKASRPWDIERDGFVMGEGAGVLLLEELEHAKRRGAKIYGKVLGGSYTTDAYHMTHPHPDGSVMSLCIDKAIAQAGINRKDVNYISAHAASTVVGDMAEYQALMRCFGKNPELKVNSIKSMTGHLLGASGAVQAIATLKAIQTGWIHPNINLENPEKCLDMGVMVGRNKESLDIKAALCSSFGFGGHNSCILLAPYGENDLV